MLAIVLSRRDFRENDQIISLYTLEQGKLEVLARGVKKILSKNAAFLEPFCFVDAEIILGKEIAHLGAVQPINIFKDIRADFKKSLAAGYMVKLVEKIVHGGEKDKRMFELIKTWLEWIDGLAVIPTAMEGSLKVRHVRDSSATLGMTLVLNAFIAKFLALLGFDPSAQESDKFTKDTLTLLVRGSWQSIDAVNFGTENMKIIQNKLYNFTTKHLERKIADWVILT